MSPTQVGRPTPSNQRPATFFNIKPIGIVGDSPIDALREIIGNNSIACPQIVSNDSVKIKESFGIHGYPTSFLIDPQGTIIAKDLRGKELEDKVLGLIK